MTAITLPEEIVPSSLTAYTGNDFTQIVAGGMPNGDDYLQVNKAANSNRQRAFQPVRTDSHLVNPTGYQSLSFWIRRRQSFTPTGGLTQSSVGGTSALTAGKLFGVGNPVGEFNLYSDMAWGWLASAATTIQFFYIGGNGKTFAGPSITLNTDQWHFMVVALSPLNFTTGDKQSLFYKDGALQGNMEPNASTSYFLDPDYQSNFDLARFAIGDPTYAENAVSGTGADGAVYDLGKLAIHNKRLTIADQLELVDSMYYGGAAP